MLSDIKSGHITGLIFSKLSRLARNTKELLEFAELFRESDANLISLAESIDHTPYGGVKDSGIGREGVASAIADMTEVRLLVSRDS